MYPSQLPRATDKDHWYHTDCFSEDENHLSRSFLHRNYRMGMHVHEFYEVNLVLAGSGCHYLEGMSMPIAAGNVFVIPPEISHGYYCQENLDVFHILLHRQFMNRWGADLSKIPGYAMLFEIEPYLRQVYDRSLFLRLHYEEVEALRQETSRLDRMEQNGLFISENIGVLNLLSELCLRMREYQQGDQERIHGDILRVLEYIHGHLDEKLSVSCLMKVAGMSASTFNRYFQTVVHCAPANYVLQCRVKKARELMADGRNNRTEIAQICGFYDVSHMNKYLRAKKNRVHPEG